MRTLLILALTCSLAHPAELPEMLQKLIDDDYDIREAATAELGKWPACYLDFFLHLSRIEPDPEMAMRLYIAAELVHAATVMRRNEEWLRANGTVHFTFNHIWVASMEPDDRVRYRLEGLRVTGVWGSCDGKLKDMDVVTTINGTLITDQIDTNNFFIPGKEYVLKVQRPANMEAARVDASDFRPASAPFEELEITITAAQRDPEFEYGLAERLEVLRDKLWRTYVRATSPNPPASSAEETSTDAHFLP